MKRIHPGFMSVTSGCVGTGAMKILNIRKSGLLNIYVLHRMVLKFVYKPEEMSETEINMMADSLKKYRDGVDWVRENEKMSTIDEEIENSLIAMETILKEDAAGKLEGRKELFLKHGIDYRKFHCLPEAYKEEDFIRGQETLKQHMKDNPKDYQ